MIEAGCERIFDMSAHAAMLLGAFRATRKGLQMLRASSKYLENGRFDAVVLLDSPTLHLPLAKKAKKLGLPVLYYIAPQLWAWGAWRIGKVRRRVDELAVIFPFEEAYYRKRGVPATFVGHPLGDDLAAQSADEDAIARLRKLGQPLVALLPGSRKHVVEAIAKDQLHMAAQIRNAFPSSAFAVSIANPSVAPIISEAVRTAPVAVKTVDGSIATLVRAADLVLVASGTTTLQVAMLGRPMVVMYKASRLAYQLVGRWLIRSPYLSLPNILAGREIVPEFMPYYSSVEPIAEKAVELLGSEDVRSSMIEDLNRVTQSLRAPGASMNTARLLLNLVDRSRAASSPKGL